MNNHSYIKECPVTGHDEQIKYFDLGNIPLVNNLCDTREEALNAERFPLNINYYPASGESSLDFAVDSELLFKNYLFKSEVNIPYVEHCKKMFKFIQEYVKITDLSKIVDIGGNDGTLLETFLKRKPYLNALNVDASENLTKLSESKGIPTYNAFWGTETAKKLNRKFKLITSTNVFQHTPPIVDFVEAISMSLDKFGIWCLEFPYWKTNMETKQYDQIYHEHVYFYLIEPLKQLLERFNLRIIKATPKPIHGGSLRLLISHIGDLGEAWQPCQYVDTAIEKEQDLTDEYYKEWGSIISKHISDCNTFLKSLKNDNKTIVGFGAAAKGCIFLNSAKIDHTILDVVVDDTDLKQNKFIPGTGIQIKDRTYLKENQVDYILILAHNFKDFIIESLRKDGYSGEFIVLFPNVEII